MMLFELLLKKHQIMEEIDEDRISNLPAEILEEILNLLPTKSVITTSALSTTWRSLSTNTIIRATNFDFGQEFADNQGPEEFTNTVGRLLSINTALEINKIRLHFDPDQRYRSLAKGWLEFATARSVKELNLNFCRLTDVKHISIGIFEIPKCLFDCASITHLKLSRCILNLPSDYTGLHLLKTLSLEYVRITASEVKKLVSNCPLIQTLVINECGPLKCDDSLFSSLSLERFTLYCWLQPIDIILINAPNLSMFSFRGKPSGHFSFIMSTLVKEAVIEVSQLQGSDCEEFYEQILRGISVVDVLTVYADYLPHYMPSVIVDFSYLKELRFLNGTGPGVTRIDVYNFFGHCLCPLLERLSIELSPYPDETFYSGEELKEERCVECIFHHLRRIEISNFQQMDCQMELLRCFLEKCPILETMNLVGPLDGDEPGGVVIAKPFYLPNAPSTARIILREY